MESGIQTEAVSKSLRLSRIFGGVTILAAVVLGVAVSNAFVRSPLSAYAIPVLISFSGVAAYLFVHNGLWILLFALAIRSSLESFSDFGVLGGLNLASLLAIAILAITLVRLTFARKIYLALNDRTIPYIFLVVWGSISALVHFNSNWTISSGIAEISRMLSNISVFWLVLAFVKEKNDFTFVLKAMTLSSLVPLGVGFISYAQGLSTSMVWGIPGLVRMKGLFAHPNNFAHYLLIIGLCSYALYRWSKLDRKRIQKPLVFLLCLIMISLALTFSRSALIGLIIAILLVGVNNKKTILKSVIFIAVLGLIFSWFFPSFVEYTFSQTLSSSNPSESTLASRFWIWEQGLDWALKSPIFGYGPGSFNKLVHIDAHNDYLRVLVEYGIPGLLLIGWVTLIQMKDGLTLLKKSKMLGKQIMRDASSGVGQSSLLDIQKGYALARVYLALLITILVMGAAANIFNFPVLQWYFFGLWGLVVAYNEYNNRQ
jgi:O-antigen ligase